MGASAIQKFCYDGPRKWLRYRRLTIAQGLIILKDYTGKASELSYSVPSLILDWTPSHPVLNIGTLLRSTIKAAVPATLYYI
jgi:hypothetical protein